MKSAGREGIRNKILFYGVDIASNALSSEDLENAGGRARGGLRV